MVGAECWRSDLDSNANTVVLRLHSGLPLTAVRPGAGVHVEGSTSQVKTFKGNKSLLKILCKTCSITLTSPS